MKKYSELEETIDNNYIPLYAKDPIIISNKENECFSKGELVWICIENIWSLRYYSHFYNNLHYCFDLQKKEGTVTAWETVLKFENCPLEKQILY